MVALSLALITAIALSSPIQTNPATASHALHRGPVVFTHTTTSLSATPATATTPTTATPLQTRSRLHHANLSKAPAIATVPTTLFTATATATISAHDSVTNTKPTAISTKPCAHLLALEEQNAPPEHEHEHDRRAPLKPATKCVLTTCQCKFNAALRKYRKKGCEKLGARLLPWCWFKPQIQMFCLKNGFDQ